VTTYRNVVFFLLGDFPAPAFYVPTLLNTLFHLHRWCKQLTPPTTEQSIKKCWHLKFRSRRATQKKEYNI